MSDRKTNPQGGAATTFIYALVDPRTNEVRYIGKSDRPNVRLWRHINESKKGEETHRARWLRVLMTKGLRPVLNIIDEVRADEWQAVEAAYIQFYRDEGCQLTNFLPGGEGPGSGPENAFFGRKHSAETVAKMSAAARNRPAPVIDPDARSRGEKHYLYGKHLPSDTRKKLSATLSGDGNPNFGKSTPKEVRAKISAALKGEKHFHFGKKASPEALAKMSAAQKGRTFSPEHLRKLREAALRRYSAKQLLLAI